MGYITRNGKIYKEIIGVYGDIHLWYVGEAPPKTIFWQAVCIMSRYESRNNTDNKTYRYAQRVAHCKLAGQDSWSNFIRKP